MVACCLSVLVAVSGCGWLHILDLHGDTDTDTMDAEVILGSDWWRDVILTPDWSQVRPIHTQRIPANVKDVIIGDINGDGSMELVISLTDRVVRTYKVKKNRC